MKAEPIRKNWINRPYYSIGDYYKERLGDRVYKVSVDVADTCPNRLGLKGMQTCTFCDVWGSSAYETQKGLPLKEQIKNVKANLKSLTDYHKFLVYFQSYTNSFMALPKLKAMYEEALEDPHVVGMVVGTRPDCLSPALLKLWGELAQKTYVSIELGAQSFYEDFLFFEKRGHTGGQTLEAIHKLSEIPNLDIGLHFILGHPGETLDHVKAQAQFVATLPIQNVKFHNLHVLKFTKLQKFYEEGVFKPIELQEYAQMVGTFIEYLPQTMAIQRLSAMASRWDELIAPEWTKHKKFTFQEIITYMHKHDMFHGKKYKNDEPISNPDSTPLKPSPESSSQNQVKKDFVIQNGNHKTDSSYSLQSGKTKSFPLETPEFFKEKIINQKPFELVLKMYNPLKNEHLNNKLPLS